MNCELHTSDERDGRREPPRRAAPPGTRSSSSCTPRMSCGTTRCTTALDLDDQGTSMCRRARASASRSTGTWSTTAPATTRRSTCERRRPVARAGGRGRRGLGHRPRRRRDPGGRRVVGRPGRPQRGRRRDRRRRGAHRGPRRHRPHPRHHRRPGQPRRPRRPGLGGPDRRPRQLRRRERLPGARRRLGQRLVEPRRGQPDRRLEHRLGRHPAPAGRRRRDRPHLVGGGIATGSRRPSPTPRPSTASSVSPGRWRSTSAPAGSRSTPSARA